MAVTAEPLAKVEVAARKLADRLKLPFLQEVDAQFELALVKTPERLELRLTADNAPGAIYVDFLGSAGVWHAGSIGHKGQPLAKAIGIGADCPSVVDATAGLGRDAFRLACLGCNVVAIERNAIVAELLRDGLTRAATVPRLESVIRDCLSLRLGDSAAILRDTASPANPDVVYLDPMFAVNETATALVKKEMRVIRELVGADHDAQALFEAAFGAARKRVVVKRARHAAPLAPNPQLSFSGKIARYDVYLKQ